MYKTGDRVSHQLFGRGVVIAVLPDSVKIKFDALATARNIRTDYSGISKIGENHSEERNRS